MNKKKSPIIHNWDKQLCFFGWKFTRCTLWNARSEARHCASSGSKVKKEASGRALEHNVPVPLLLYHLCIRAARCDSRRRAERWTRANIISTTSCLFLLLLLLHLQLSLSARSKHLFPSQRAAKWVRKESIKVTERWRRVLNPLESVWFTRLTSAFPFVIIIFDEPSHLATFYGIV